MSKIIEATCEGGVVKVGNLPISDAVIGSEGVGSSQGILLIEEDESHYLAKISPDLKTTLEKVCDALQGAADALTRASTSLTSIGAGMTGPTTAPPPTLAADVTYITTKVTAIATARTALNTLKGNLK